MWYLLNAMVWLAGLIVMLPAFAVTVRFAALFYAYPEHLPQDTQRLRRKMITCAQTVRAKAVENLARTYIQWKTRARMWREQMQRSTATATATATNATGAPESTFSMWTPSSTCTTGTWSALREAAAKNAFRYSVVVNAASKTLRAFDAPLPDAAETVAWDPSSTSVVSCMASWGENESVSLPLVKIGKFNALVRGAKLTRPLLQWLLSEHSFEHRAFGDDDTVTLNVVYRVKDGPSPTTTQSTTWTVAPGQCVDVDTLAVCAHS